MVKRLILLSPVLIGLLFFGIAGEDSADLLAQLEQAETYMKNGQYQQAEVIYQQIVTDYPGTEYAFKARENLVIVYVAMDSQSETEAALQKLLTDFSEHQYLPHAVHKIAKQCCKLEKGDTVRQLYQDVLDNQPEIEQAIWLQMGLAHSNIYLGDDNAAAAAIDELIVQFSEDNWSAEAVGQIAWSYRKLKRYERAKQLYQYVVDNWAYKKRAIFSQRGVARCNIALGNEKAAWAAVERLLGEFSEDEHIADVFRSIAKDYRKLGKYKEARILHQYVLDSCPESEQAILSQRDVVLLSIGLGDDPNTEAAIEQLISSFPGHKHLAEAVYQVARKLESDEKASVLYQYVIENCSDSKYAILSKVKIGGIYIRLGEEAAGRAIFDRVLVDFADHPDLPKAVSLMAYEYYKQALFKETEGYPEQAREYFLKTIVESERIVTQFPEIPDIASETCYFLAVCHERLGQYIDAVEYYQMVLDNWPDYKYAWHALFRIGCGYETLKQRGLISELEADAIIKDVYQQLLETYPTCKVAVHARTWLSRHK